MEHPLDQETRRMLQETHDSTIRQETQLNYLTKRHDENHQQLWQQEKRLRAVEEITQNCVDRRKFEKRIFWSVIGSIVLAAGASIWATIVGIFGKH